MATKSPFLVRERNPDVLTSIANLSNDEVFTPPSFANKMLDTLEKAWAESNNGASIWEDETVKFLDPFTKSGVFLREIVRRLNEGLTKRIPDQQERVNHILANQVFGIAITRLTALTSRRSVYCSKLANGKHSIATVFDNEEGSIWFKRTEHTWVGGDRKVLTVDKEGKEVEKTLGGKCKHCGASQSEYEREFDLESHAYALIHTEDPKQLIKEVFGEEMQFDVIIGNPPYQLNDGGGLGSSAVPIYQHFITQAMKLEPRYLSVVVPSRWFVGGKGLNAFREMMLKDTRVRRIVDYLETSAVFPGVQLKGGVCYFLWERDNRGKCEIETHHNGALIHSDVRPLLEPGLDFFIRFGQAIPILRKIIHSSSKAIEAEDLLPKEPFRFSSIVSPRRPFGLASNFEGKGKPGDKGVVTLFQNGGTSFVSRDQIPTNKSWIDKWKVYISFAYGAGESYPHSILGKPIIGEPGTACTETYLLIGPFESKLECESVVSYIQTRLFRFLVLQKKQTQNGTRQVYDLVPILKWDHKYTDEELNKKFNLLPEDVSFVNSLVRPVLEDANA